MVLMAVELSNGSIIRSDSNDEATRDELEESIADFLSDWSKVNNLRVTKFGHDIHVNPAHICAVWVEEV